MGISMTSGNSSVDRSQSTSELSRPGILRRRGQSAPEESTTNNNDKISNDVPKTKRQRKSSFRFPRPRSVKERSKSDPVLDNLDASSNPKLEERQPLSQSLNQGRERTRRRLSLFRRNSPPIALQRNDSRSLDSKVSKGTEESHGCHSEDDRSYNLGVSLMERTKIVTELASPKDTDDLTEADEEEEGTLSNFNCATAILGHTYLERICCGEAAHSSFDDMHAINQLSEDPTIQESIECIFASQLEDGLKLWDEDEEEELVPLFRKPSDLVSPSALQQSRLNRSDRKLTSLSQSKKRYEQASLVYVGTFDPTIADEINTIDENEGPLPCPCSHTKLPSIDPKDWPQAPLLLRPTPGSGTRIKGVRMGNSKDYLWEPESHLSWSECLAKRWGKPCQSKPRFGCCEKCAILPINNGNEESGESMVIDFETDLFEGSFLLRLRFSEGTTPEPYDDTKGYFKGVNRRYQAIVRGRFKKSIPLTQLVTGFQFNRPCGKLPAKWILRGGLKVLGFFAPQLDAKFEGDKPYSLTPLGSTPQSLCVDAEEIDLLESDREEPTDAKRTLLGETSMATTSLQRARIRKKAFDKLFVQKSVEPKTDLSKTYTFEFLQHLFNFQHFSIELGSMLGSVRLEEILNGQPLQIMAGHGDQPLWSFDVWHECLWEQAKKHDA
jgi:hypothetical protein